jgi:MoaD family protein
MATVQIPSTLRSFTHDHAEVRVRGATVEEVLDNLDRNYPGIGAKLRDDDGALRRYVNVFHNADDIRAKQGLETAVEDEDRITIIPAVAGG